MKPAFDRSIIIDDYFRYLFEDESELPCDDPCCVDKDAQFSVCVGNMRLACVGREHCMGLGLPCR
jgi:hypothetical protein